MILCEQPHANGAVTLLVDIGTNAEIVLGTGQRLLACSSPTGPAFEGAQVSAGQRAAPGAIERVRIDPDTLETRIRVIGSDLWSDEPGFGDALPAQGVTGICGSGIIEAVVEMWLAGILTSDGVIDGGQATAHPRLVREGRTFSFVIHGEQDDKRITVTQTDVRQIQLAKAALFAGIRLLMDRLEVTSVDRIRLAGAFGSHIDVRYAMALGMIPDCPLDAVSAAGNAAGHGARIALLNRASRDEIESVVKARRKSGDRRRAELPGVLRRCHGDTGWDPRIPRSGEAASCVPAPTGPPERNAGVRGASPPTQVEPSSQAFLGQRESGETPCVFISNGQVVNLADSREPLCLRHL